MDDDHIGSLKTLIYFMYFIHNKKLIIMCGEDVHPHLKTYLCDLDGFIDGGSKIEEKLYILNPVSIGVTLDDGTYLTPTKNFHFKPSYGIVLSQTDENGKQVVGISSDGFPKGDDGIVHMNTDIVFHDFSYWNAPDKQVHMCFSTIPFPFNQKENTEMFYKRMFPYHDDKPFAEFWGTVGDYKRLPRFEQFHKEVEDWWVNKKGLKCKWLENN